MDKINHILKKIDPKKINESHTNKKAKNKAKKRTKIPNNNIEKYALSDFDNCSLNNNKSIEKSKKLISKKIKENKQKNQKKIKGLHLLNQKI